MFAICTILGCGLLIWAMLNTGHDWGGDFAGYIMQARSLVEGDVPGYLERNGHVINNSTRKPGPIAYPWGASILLAGPYALFGSNLLALKSINLISYLCFMVCLWWFAWKAQRGIFRYCLLLAFALNPSMLHACNRIMSDMPFLFLSTAAVMVIAGMTSGREGGVPSLRKYCVLGALIALSMFFRRTGVLLLPTLFAAQVVEAAVAWRRHGNSETHSPIRVSGADCLRALAPYGVCLLVFVVLEGIFPAEEATHIERLGKIHAARAAEQFHDFLRLPRDFFVGLNRDGWRVDRVLHAVSLPFVLLGVVARRRTDYPFALYSLLVFTLHVFWPSHLDLRYLLPTLPFYIHFVLAGLEASWSMLNGRSRRVVRTTLQILVLVIIAGFGLVSLSRAVNNVSYDRRAPDGPYTKVAQAMFTAVREHTDDEEVVAFFKPRVMLLNADRLSVRVGNVEELDRADYVVLRRSASTLVEAYQPELAAMESSGALVVLYENWMFRLCRLAREETR